MKKYLFLFFIILFFVGNSQSQKIVATKINQIELEADKFLGYDAFGSYYSVKNNVFSITKDGISLEYRNIALGEITHIDRQSPLKMVLFYENFNTVILLDNQLNESQKINFSECNSPVVATAVGLASQNRLWVYNNLTQELGFFDYLKNSFQSLTPPFVGSIKYYFTNFNTFQWVDENWNLYSCNVFGKIIKLAKLPDFDQIQWLTDQTFIFSKEGIIYFYDIESAKNYTIENVEKTWTNFYYKDQILSIFTNHEINNYKIILP